MKNEVLTTCENPACGQVFPFPIEFLGEGGNSSPRIIFKGGHIACRACGSPARIHDGEYSWRDYAFRLISGPPQTVEALQRAKQIIEAAATAPEPQTPAEAERQKQEVINQVAAASPQLASFISNINFENFHKWVASISTIITLVLTYYVGVVLPNSADEANKRYNDHLNKEVELLRQQVQQSKQQAAPAPLRNKAHQHSPGRNDACPCGSGRKYKKCCGFQTAHAGPQ